MLQACEISVPTSSRSAFPRALKKIAFPRARVPKTPGTRIQERAPSSGRLGSEVRERYVRPTEFRRSGLEVRTIEDQRERESEEDHD